MKYRDFLRDELKGVIPDNVVLPSGFHLVGHVALLHLNSETMGYASSIGEKTLQFNRRILSVAARTGPTEGVMRLPSYELIAGLSNTTTIHCENGVHFLLDPLRLTFSGGNRRERMRLSRLVKEGEHVVDMFSCVGQFALHIAKSTDVKVTAIEINEEAFHYLLENIRLNGLGRKVSALLGDCRLVHPRKTANRVVMGYLHDTIGYLPSALETLVEDGGIVHMHMNVPEFELENKIVDIKETCRNSGYDSTVNTIHVKNYSPGVGHYVFDIITMA